MENLIAAVDRAERKLAAELHASTEREQRADREALRESALAKASERAAQEIASNLPFTPTDARVARIAAIIYRAFREAKEL